jgi:hypothetical protein
VTLPEDIFMRFSGSWLQTPGSRSARLVATLVVAAPACFIAGCGKHEPSYNDRIGTIDPATAPVIMPDAPAPPPKKQR